MKRDDDRDELDDLIDRALPGYSSANPIHGLEERVLARVRVAGAAPQSRWPDRWAFAIPALAAVLLVCLVLRTSWEPPSQTTNVRPRHAAPAVTAFKTPAPALLPGQVPTATKPTVRNRAGQDHSARSRDLPKKERFPTPVPMTAEEHALVAWAGRAPAEATQAFTDLQRRTDEAVSIQPIQIQPLHSDGAQ